MRINMNDIALYQVLNLHAKALDELAQREYSRAKVYRGEVEKMHCKARECMDAGDKLAEKVAEIDHKAESIRRKYEAAGFGENFDSVYQQELEELE